MIKARTAKAKGRKLEKWLEGELSAAGLMARSQPGSGIYSDFPHDVEARLPDGTRLLVECKQRKASAWKTGDKWIGAADMLVVRMDAPKKFGATTPEPMVYLTWRTFLRLLRSNPPVTEGR